MIALLSLLVPPFILVLAREKILRRPNKPKQRAIVYIFSTLGLNWTMMLLLSCVFHSTGDLFAKLNGYLNFACKYIFLAILLAVAEPFAEYCIRERLDVRLPRFKRPVNWKHFRLCAGFYAAILFFLNFIRIFDDNFWFDEAVTLLQMNSTFSEITEWAANDVHPPLYYYMLKVVHMISGSQGWAYHALSLIPCLIILILALTLFWNKFGGRVSVILITFIGLSYNAVYYNMEVRTYSWANLAVLLSFYELWQILEEHRKRDYLFFALFSLAAAYMHYFAMVTVAFFYVVLMITAILRKSDIKMVLATWLGTIIGYLPWAVRFLKTVRRTADGFWVRKTPSFAVAVEYLFSSRFKGWTIWCILIAAAALFFLYETNILTVAVKEKKLYISLSFRQIRISDYVIWSISGILCSLGTILFAIIYSRIIIPVFSIRYIYAASVTAWMVLAVVISRLKFGRLWTVILWLFLLAGFIPQYQEIYTHEKTMADNLQKTLSQTADICENDIRILLIQNSQRAYTALEYYYPSYTQQIIDLYEMPELDKTTSYYLFVFPPETDMEPFFKELDRQGFCCTLAVDNGNLGTMAVNVYWVEGQEESEEAGKDAYGK